MVCPEGSVCDGHEPEEILIQVLFDVANTMTDFGRSCALVRVAALSEILKKTFQG